ncbi:MAG TPA: IS21-like element helper ATPase IstB [Steroidobacteraceae bacterium]|nr:IS21-like element helper ATPase IstB [Steroidobacteraceae bacterium]
MSAVAVREEVLQLRLKGLRLPSFLAHYASLAKKATAEGWGPIEYLSELVDVEVAERADRRLKRLLDEAELPAGKTLTALELTRYPPPMRAQIQELCRGQFLTDATNVCLVGKPGTGKSHIMAAIARSLVERGSPVFYTTVAALVEKLLAAKRDLRLARELKRLDRFECLALDDIGYVQQDRAEMEVLFALLAERYERKSVMITSNLVFSQWDQIFKDPMTTAAAIDRVVHHAVVLEFKGPSFRAEEAERRAAALAKEHRARSQAS